MCVAPPLKVSALFNPVTRQWVVLSSRLSSTPPLEKIFYTFNSANPGIGTNLCGWRPRAGPFQSKWHTRLLSNFTDLGQGNTLQLAMISDCQTEFGHGVHALTSSLLEPTYFDERCILILYVLSVDNMMRLLATFSRNAPLPLNTWALVRGKIQKSSSEAPCFYLLAHQMLDRLPKKEIEVWAITTWSLWTA